MLEINVTVAAPELAGAIQSLAAALSGTALPTPASPVAPPPCARTAARSRSPRCNPCRRSCAYTAARSAACGACGSRTDIQP